MMITFRPTLTSKFIRIKSTIAAVLAAGIFFLLTPSIFGATENEVLPFHKGERLEFNVYFEFILGGHASMAIEETVDFDGNTAFHFVSKARSAKAVDFFYKVRDRVESWWDVDGRFSRRFSKKLREGKHKYDREVNYFPENNYAIAVDRKKKNVPDTLSLQSSVQDVLSAFYKTRTYELKVGEVVGIVTEDDGKIYELQVHVLRKEQVEVAAGTFDCFVVEPRLKTSGLFRKQGQMEIWLTDDERKMPVLMKSRLYFGRVWAKLQKYDLGEE